MVSPSPADAPPLALGAIVDGRYEVRSVVGTGAMGMVYEVRHLRLDCSFAMKVMTPEHALSKEAVMRFHREARAAASVGHPNIVEVTDMGQLEDGTPYLVQELLPGRHLADRVATDGVFDPRRAIHVTRQICQALEAVHARRIVHRDLKPENVMLVERNGDPDFVKVLDFGICTLLDPEDEGPYARLTRTNVSLGTPLFMAPEQFSSDVQLDGRTDIHAVGAILYFLLTERPLYECRDLRHLCMRISAEPPPSLRMARPDVPAELDAVLQRACAKSQQARYASCGVMIEALDEVAELLGDRRDSLVRLRSLADTRESLASLPALQASLAETRAPGAPPAPGEGEADDTELPSFLRPPPSRGHMLRMLALLVLVGVGFWLGRMLWPTERLRQRATEGAPLPATPAPGSAPTTPAEPEPEPPPEPPPEPDGRPDAHGHAHCRARSCGRARSCA